VASSRAPWPGRSRSQTDKAIRALYRSSPVYDQSSRGGELLLDSGESVYGGRGQIHSGAREAGVITANPHGPTEFNSTFVGVGLDSSHPEILERLIYCVGDGKVGYRTNLVIPDTAHPFKITEGEFEIFFEHDVGANGLQQTRVNGVDVTDQWAFRDRRLSATRFVRPW